MSYLVEKILKEAEEKNLVEFVSRIKQLEEEFRKKGCTVMIDFRQENSINLTMIKVPERNAGTGTKFMEQLTNLADEYGVIVTLSPSSEYGSSMNRLIKFYKRFGFQLNKGKKADHRFWCGMIRYPSE